jgi:hypothetical protein
METREGVEKFIAADNVVRTGEDGTFQLMCRFPLDERWNLEGLVVARHPEFGVALTPWDSSNPRVLKGTPDLQDVPPELLSSTDEYLITLPDRAKVHGTVKDSMGNLLAGAVISATVPVLFRPASGDDEPIPQQTNSILSATSSSDGTYELDGLPSGLGIAIHAWHSEAGRVSVGDNSENPGELPFNYIPGPDSLDLVLPGAGSLEGIISLSQGQILPEGACVRIRSEFDLTLEPSNAPVDATGKYAVSALPPGSYSLELVAPPVYGNAEKVVILTATATEAPPIHAGPGAVLAGTFVHPETGEIVGDAKARIDLFYLDGGHVTVESTAGDGHFEINARPGVVAMYATGLNGDVVAEESEKRLVLKHGTRNESLSFPFVPYRIVHGQVLLASGEAAAGALVGVSGQNRTTTDTSGNFSMPLPAHDLDGNPKTFTATLENGSLFMGATTLPQAEFLENRIAITVKEPASITGTVLDLDGSPIVGCPTTLNQLDVLSIAAITDANGKYVHRQLFPDLPIKVDTHWELPEEIQPLHAGEMRDIGAIRIIREAFLSKAPVNRGLYPVQKKEETQ